MGSLSLAALCDGVAATLGAATGIGKVQSYDELSEGFEDLPLMRVYPSAGETDAGGGGSTDRTTFRAGVRQTEVEVTVDLPCAHRNQLDENSKKVVEITEAVVAVLEAQRTKPYFATAGIQAFRWRWERTLFVLPGSSGEEGYLGVRFKVTVRIF